MSEEDEGRFKLSTPQPMRVAELMALLEGCDWRSEVRLAFVTGDAAQQAAPTGVAGFTVASVASPLPPPQPSTVWIIAAQDTAPFLTEAWIPVSYRRP